MTTEPGATRRPPLVATSRGQYTLIDSGNLGAQLRYLWIEMVGGSSRTMAGFCLACDALELFAYYQRREDAEAEQAALCGPLSAPTVARFSGSTT